MFEFDVADGVLIVGCPVRELGLPPEALLVVVLRDGQALPPRGSTVIRAGDRLYVLSRTRSQRAVQGLIESWQEDRAAAPS